jgi:hypothetical protein
MSSNSYTIKGYCTRGGWPFQAELYDAGSLSDAIEWCKGYTSHGDWGGYDALILYSDCDVQEGWFDENGFTPYKE